ncbi:MAG: hypothetical protein HYV14_06225 [Elusimicrobia bacterium]|nr:hypothetical protein [Elusimicrobiota bacterium]
MKGKLWELGPFVLALLVAGYFIVDHFRRTQPDSVLVSAPGRPLTGSTPRVSTGPGDPTRPEDFLPDPDSKPDPNSLPDPSLSTATRGAPAKPRP